MDAAITTPTQPVSQSHQRWKQHGISDANAATGITETPAAVVPYASVFVCGNLAVPANIASSASTYAVVTVAKRTGNGAAVTVATANLANVAMTAFVPVALTPVANAANLQLAQGDLITVTVTKASTGAYLANGANAVLDLVIEDIA